MGETKENYEVEKNMSGFSNTVKTFMKSVFIDNNLRSDIIIFLVLIIITILYTQYDLTDDALVGIFQAGMFFVTAEKVSEEVMKNIK